MTTIVPTMTHGERILWVLSDGKFHSTANIHRQAGNMIVHSRIAELRSKGHAIEHEHVPGRIGAQAHRYRWTNIPEDCPYRARETPVMADPGIPNSPETRYRIYTRVYDDLRCIAAAATPEALGVALVTMGLEGEFDGFLVGVMDRPGDEPGTWIVKPWCPE